MEISKTTDEIYNDLLVAHLNKSGKNAGLLIQIVYTAVAAIAWGIYEKLRWVARQIFPDTSSAEWVEKHAVWRGLTITGKTTDEILESISVFEVYPQAGGNYGDWVRWIEGYQYIHDEGEPTEWTETVTAVYPKENARGGGTINIVILTDRTTAGSEEVATTEILSALGTFIDSKRLLGIWDYELYSAAHLDTSVAIQIEASNYDYVSDALETALPVYMKSIAPGDSMRLTSCESTALLLGATDANVTSPAANVATDNGPDTYERIWPDMITVGVMA